jgi:hypothetical protein
MMANDLERLDNDVMELREGRIYGGGRGGGNYKAVRISCAVKIVSLLAFYGTISFAGRVSLGRAMQL